MNIIANKNFSITEELKHKRTGGPGGIRSPLAATFCCLAITSFKTSFEE